MEQQFKKDMNMKISFKNIILWCIMLLIIEITCICGYLIGKIAYYTDKNILPYIIIAENRKSQMQVEMKLLNLENRVNYLERYVIARKNKRR